MSFNTGFTQPFFGGTGVSSLVPSKYPVALAGRTYLLDLKAGLRFQSIPLLRQQSDESASPSEASLNPDDLWRRAQDSWHFGAGQVFRDRPGSNAERFRSSKGIDPWTKYKFSLLPATDQKDTSSDTNLALTPAGARLYKVEGSTLTYATDVTVDSPTWNAVTYAGGAITSIASDGFHVWVTDGTNTYVTNTGIATSSVHDALDTDVLGYVKGRLMAAHDNSIYDDTLAGTPAALFSHANTDFRWVGFAEGRAAIYAAGFSGDKSLVYRIAVKPDASGLDQPILAGELPDGEIIRSIYGYLGFVFLGTDKGVRFALPDGQGNLEIGPVIETESAVRCFEGQDRFVWFGWTNYDATSTGLGRLDITAFTEPGVPAYASDLMVTAQGNVLSACTFQDIRVFSVSASGIWAQDTPKVASGTVDTGLIGYGLPDRKVALFADVRTEPLDGSYVVSLAADGDGFEQIGSETTADDDGEEFPCGETIGERFELRFVLTRSGTDTTTGPTVTRWTLKANPQAALREYIELPLLFHDPLQVKGQDEPFDIDFELEQIRSLRSTRRMVALQVFTRSYSVSVEDFTYEVHHAQPDDMAYNGTMVVRTKVIQ